MIFEFTPNANFNFLQSFADQIGVEVEGDIINLSPTLGEGFIRRIRLSSDFSIINHHYTLTEELILRRKATIIDHNKINILFHLNDKPFSATPASYKLPYSGNDLAIRITSTNIGSEINFPAHTKVYFSVLSITRIGLKTLLNFKNPNSTINTILNGETGFLFYENMSDEMQKALKIMTLTNMDQDLGQLKVWIKMQELLYLLFGRLLTRESITQKPVHPIDSERILLIKQVILADLAIPPSLTQLANTAGMSVSRLTDLFKQVFGYSIYQYYQNARMEEAAQLISHQGYTVSETGYQLGFSNLSHFSRLFERYHGIKPKRFSQNIPASLSDFNLLT